MSGVVVLNSQLGIQGTDGAGEAISGSTTGQLIAGSDGSFIRFARVASDGTLRIDPTGTTAQPVSQSGVWATRLQDGYGLPLTASSSTPTGSETALIVRVVGGLPVSIDSSGLALETGGNLAATATSLAVLDDWDETDRAKVNLIVGQAGVAGGYGTIGSNTQRVAQAAASSANVTSVNASTSSTTLLAANPSRLGGIFFNDSTTSTMYVKFGSAASSTSYTYRLPPETILELNAPMYTGVIDCIWTSTDGAARITELT